MEVTKELITLVTGYETISLSDEDFQTLAQIALARLQGLLCDPDLSLDNLPIALLPLFGDLLRWTTLNNPKSSGVLSETGEIYSYTLKADEEANDLIRLRNKYGDLINQFSKCEGKDGVIENAKHNPLWTHDYYWENQQ